MFVKSDKAVYDYIANNSNLKINDEFYCTDTNGEIAKKLNLSDRTIRRSIARLQDEGFISRVMSRLRLLRIKITVTCTANDHSSAMSDRMCPPPNNPMNTTYEASEPHKSMDDDYNLSDQNQYEAGGRTNVSHPPDNSWPDIYKYLYNTHIHTYIHDAGSIKSNITTYTSTNTLYTQPETIQTQIQEIPPSPPIVDKSNKVEMEEQEELLERDVRKKFGPVRFMKRVGNRGLSFDDCIEEFKEYWFITKGRKYNVHINQSKGVLSAFEKWLEVKINQSSVEVTKETPEGSVRSSDNALYERSIEFFRDYFHMELDAVGKRTLKKRMQTVDQRGEIDHWKYFMHYILMNWGTEWEPVHLLGYEFENHWKASKSWRTTFSRQGMGTYITLVEHRKNLRAR